MRNFRLFLLAFFLMMPFGFSQDKLHKDRNLTQSNQEIGELQIIEFLKVLNNEDFYVVREKGNDIFKEGNILPNNFQMLLSKHLNHKDSAQVTYEFYDDIVLRATLTVDINTRKVVYFNTFRKHIKK